MSLISLRQLLDHAAEQNYAVPAFNIQTLEQIIAIMKAANKTNSPVILQISTKTEKYLTSTFIRYLIKATIEKYSKIPICIHYDHARSIKVCKEAIKLGCSSIMMDGSLQSNGITPSNIKYNIEVTQHAVNLAHNEGISVEGEIGCLGAINQSSEKSNVINALSNKIFLTQPKEALMFVQATNVDALAITIGTDHGMNKFKEKPNENTLVTSQVKKINKIIPNTHLVIHGASSIPQKWIEIINENGGNIDKSYGVPTRKIIEMIKYGVRKVNIDTDLRMIMTGTIRKFFNTNRKAIDCREYNTDVIEAISNACEKKYNDFKCAGMASKIKNTTPLTIMKKKYASNQHLL